MAYNVPRQSCHVRVLHFSNQLERLEEVFMEQRYPDIYRREEIAVQLDLKEEVVRVGLPYSAPI